MLLNKLIIVLCALSFGLQAQTFRTVESLCDSCGRDLSFRLESASFFKNNEYAHDFTAGFTGIGFFAKPTLEYYIQPHTRLNTGVFLLQYSGTTRFKQVIPIFTVQHRFFRGFEVVLGSLYGALNHRLEEPLYRFDRYYQNNVEYGIQFLGNFSRISFDLWLNWERYIFKNDPYREAFVVGNHTRLQLAESGALGVYWPLQFLITHKGGEIDRSPKPANTILNGLTGLDIRYTIGENKQLALQGLAFRFAGRKMPEPWDNAPFPKSGYGYYLKLKYIASFWDARLGYWTGRGFVAPRGEFLFQSVSESRNDFYSARRRLLTGRVRLKHILSQSIRMEFRTDGYFDLVNKNLSYSYGLYFVINDLTFLQNFKERR
ncbi:MAG: hypothetical protein D6677_06650 [Calditrichaeota bacterium]|nr:MAG: hypothetical protein D6677_06650 [Calditrichota bacterium]